MDTFEVREGYALGQSKLMRGKQEAEMKLAEEAVAKWNVAGHKRTKIVEDPNDKLSRGEISSSGEKYQAARKELPAVLSPHTTIE